MSSKMAENKNESKESWEEEFEKQVASGNFIKLQGCEECDSIVGCNCLKERLAKVMADYHKEQQAEITRIKHAGCTCTPEMLESEDEEICEHCSWREANRCAGCGAFPDQDCSPSCFGDEEEEEEEEEDEEDSEDEYDRKERIYREWKADQHKYGF